MTTPETSEYPYKPKLSLMLLVICFSGGCAALSTHEALTNDRGLVINGIITLSTGGAAIFYWCLSALMGLFVAVGVLGSIVALFTNRVVRLSATELSAPRHLFSRTNTVVPLSEIRAITIQTVQKLRFLKIRHARGRLTISQADLPGPAAFDEIVSSLVEANPSLTSSP